MASQLVWHIRAQRNTWINPCERWASLLMQQIDKVEFEHAIQPSESLLMQQILDVVLSTTH